MILNAEELKQMIQKQLESGETVRVQMEATLQISNTPESEGLVAVTPLKIIFAHRPSFGDPQFVSFNRSVVSIVGKQEDLWGASLKAKSGDTPFDLKRMNPSDFKQLWAELSGEAAPDAGGQAIQDARQAILGTMNIQTRQPITMAQPVTSPPTLPPLDAISQPGISERCYIHTRAAATAKCDLCGKAICAQCATPMRFKTYCPNCLAEARKKIEAMKDRTREVKPPPPPPFSQVRERMAAPSGVVEARSPALAFLFSFMPGFGQFYNKQYGKGLIVMLTFPIVVTWLWGFADAVSETNKHNAALGVRTQPSGFFTFLLLILPVSTILVLLLVIGSRENRKANGIVIKQPAASDPIVSQQQIEVKRAKVSMLLMKYYELQRKNFAQNKIFMTEIPDQIENDNDTGYRLELIMLGKNQTDFRLIAWAIIGDDKKLDLWSVGSGGFVAHEYAPD